MRERKRQIRIGNSMQEGKNPCQYVRESKNFCSDKKERDSESWSGIRGGISGALREFRAINVKERIQSDKCEREGQSWQT